MRIAGVDRRLLPLCDGPRTRRRAWFPVQGTQRARKESQLTKQRRALPVGCSKAAHGPVQEAHFAQLGDVPLYAREVPRQGCFGMLKASGTSRASLEPQEEPAALVELRPFAGARIARREAVRLPATAQRGPSRLRASCTRRSEVHVAHTALARHVTQPTHDHVLEQVPVLVAARVDRRANHEAGLAPSL